MPLPHRHAPPCGSSARRASRSRRPRRRESVFVMQRKAQVSARRRELRPRVARTLVSVSRARSTASCGACARSRREHVIQKHVLHCSGACVRPRALENSSWTLGWSSRNGAVTSDSTCGGQPRQLPASAPPIASTAGPAVATPQQLRAACRAARCTFGSASRVALLMAAAVRGTAVAGQRADPGLRALGPQREQRLPTWRLKLSGFCPSACGLPTADRGRRASAPRGVWRAWQARAPLGRCEATSRRLAAAAGAPLVKMISLPARRSSSACGRMRRSADQRRCAARKRVEL